MNLPLPPPAPSDAAKQGADPDRDWVRVLVNIAVAIIVVAVGGAAFVLSYPGVHAIALEGGVSTQLARYYPGLFDAVLVIACVAAVVLRGGRWWAQLWAWVVIIVVLAGIGTVDVLHAMNYTLRHRPTEGGVAAAPVVAVLLAFSLLLTLLQHSRDQAPGAGTGREARRSGKPQPTGPLASAPTGPAPVLPAPVLPIWTTHDPTAESEPPTVSAPGIRYASTAVPQPATASAGEDTAAAADSYWDAGDQQLAGQVYPDPAADAGFGIGGHHPETEDRQDGDDTGDGGGDNEGTVPTAAAHFNRKRSAPVPPGEDVN